jgi:predicted transcriptional regulator
MPQSALEIAKELTMALIETGNVPPEDMQDTLQKTHATLTALKAQEAAGTPIPVSDAPLENWRKSITKHTVACLACGQPFKQLSRRHLQERGLDGRSYRAKYGISRTQPLAAKETTARRNLVVRRTRPWEKALMYRQAQERDDNTAPKPEAEAPKRKRIPPTRQRKAARKKSSEG